MFGCAAELDGGARHQGRDAVGRDQVGLARAARWLAGRRRKEGDGGAHGVAKQQVAANLRTVPQRDLDGRVDKGRPPREELGS